MKTLKDFYQTYAAWLDAGAPDGKPFYRHLGLCAAATNYGPGIRWEVKKQFIAAGMDPLYPFGGEYAFETEYDNATAHLNPERIEWVRENCK